MSAPNDADRADPASPYEHGFDETPAETVVTRVAKMLGRSPLEMEPLFEVVDPDALNRLFDATDESRSSVTVTFDYCGRQVAVTAGGIQLAPPGAAEE